MLLDFVVVLLINWREHEKYEFNHEEYNILLLIYDAGIIHSADLYISGKYAVHFWNKPLFIN